MVGPITAELHIDLAGRRDLAAQIYRQVLDAILDGRLTAGQRLPPTRELAERLAVARNTVASAYDRLTAEGFLLGRGRAGTFVAALIARKGRRAPRGAVMPRKVWRSMPLLRTGESPPPYDFGVGVPDGRLFPVETWRRLVGRHIRRVDNAGYSHPCGLPRLRAAIARYYGQTRSVRADSLDVVVTQGAQQAIDLLARVLVDPGATVAVEEPGYPPARRLFESAGARVVGVPVSSDGLDVDALPRDARLVYTTPSHQFPLGMAMSLPNRRALLDWATDHDAVIVEDDYDTEFRYADRPLAPLQSLDRSGRVVYVGTFSKTLLPSLRLGFLVAPVSLQPALQAAKQLTDWHNETVNQAAMAEFLDEGLLARHVKKAMRTYQSRRAQIVEILRRDFATTLTMVPSVAGLHLCTRSAPDITIDWQRLQSFGVGVEPLARYCAGAAQPGVVIGYGAIHPERITDGMRLLHSAVRRSAGSPAAGQPPPAGSMNPRSSVSRWSRR